jgi:hypothetical protein
VRVTARIFCSMLQQVIAIGVVESLRIHGASSRHELHAISSSVLRPLRLCLSGRRRTVRRQHFVGIPGVLSNLCGRAATARRRTAAWITTVPMAGVGLGQYVPNSA